MNHRYTFLTVILLVTGLKFNFDLPELLSELLSGGSDGMSDNVALVTSDIAKLNSPDFRFSKSKTFDRKKSVKT